MTPSTPTADAPYRVVAEGRRFAVVGPDMDLLVKDESEAEELRENFNTCFAAGRASAGEVVELASVARKLAAWLEQRHAQASAEAEKNAGKFESLASACRHDAKNYKTIANELRAALATYDSRGGAK